MSGKSFINNGYKTRIKPQHDFDIGRAMRQTRGLKIAKITKIALSSSGSHNFHKGVAEPM
jgi:hypothetical protein